jgi:hypothetical protein
LFAAKYFNLFHLKKRGNTLAKQEKRCKKISTAQFLFLLFFNKLIFVPFVYLNIKVYFKNKKAVYQIKKRKIYAWNIEEFSIFAI